MEQRDDVFGAAEGEIRPKPIDGAYREQPGDRPSPDLAYADAYWAARKAGKTIPEAVESAFAKSGATRPPAWGPTLTAEEIERRRKIEPHMRAVSVECPELTAIDRWKIAEERARA